MRPTCRSRSRIISASNAERKLTGGRQDGGRPRSLERGHGFASRRSFARACRRDTPGRRMRLFANDILIVESDPHDLHSLVTSASLVLIGPKTEEPDGRQPTETAVAEAVLTAGSPMIGRSSAQMRAARALWRQPVGDQPRRQANDRAARPDEFQRRRCRGASGRRATP